MDGSALFAVLFCVYALDASRAAPSLTFRQTRVVGGSDISIWDTPYQIAMEYSGIPYCSATIISDLFAVTASHCLERFDPGAVAVRSGSSKPGFGGHVSTIRNFTKNSNFTAGALDYDVAVFHVEEPFAFDESRGAIALGDGEPLVGEGVTVSGWGRTTEKGDLAGNLKSANVRIISRELCRQFYKDKVNITDRMFCAGATGRDSCNGDSGAPATVNGKLVGLVSWGLGCARDPYPGVYTNLMNPEIRRFIKELSGV